MIQQFIGATGGSNRLGFGSGTPINQSVALFQAGPGTINNAGSQKGTISKVYTVWIPSGTSIETYIMPITGGGGAVGANGTSGTLYSATGTYFGLRLIGV